MAAAPSRDDIWRAAFVGEGARSRRRGPIPLQKKLNR
jgi:hypothetical protein